MITHYNDNHIEIIAFERAKRGNDCCGDEHIVIQTKTFTICAVVDGLGSGQGAYEAAQIIAQIIKEKYTCTIEQIMELCNEAMMHHRGAVMSIIKIHYVTNEIQYCNVGNVRFTLYYPNKEVIRPIPTRGYLSGRHCTVTSERFKYEKGCIFLLYSDGVLTIPPMERMFRLGQLEDLTERIVKEATYAEDDITLLVGKIGSAQC